MHLSSSYTGGAGIAARSLNRALNSAGINSTFVSISKRGYELEEDELSINRNILETFGSRVVTKFQVSVNTEMLLTPISLGLTGLDTYLGSQVPRETIIHIHNWYNLITIHKIRELIAQGFRIIMTLHDQRIFTGGCHFSRSCKGFKSNCANCPEMLVGKSLISKTMVKQSALKEVYTQVQFISPSKWLRSVALESKLMQNSNIEYIPNVLPIPKFSQTAPIGNRIVTLGVASIDPFLKIKGGEIVQNLSARVDISSPIKVEFLRNYPGAPEEFWSKIDALLVPSEADNSPNVIFEAAIRGIPVIGSKVGGIPELLTPEFDLAVDFNNTPMEVWLAEFAQINLQNNVDKKMRKIQFASKSNLAAVKSHINLYSRTLLKPNP